MSEGLKVIEIPLRDEKRRITVSVKEEDIITIDKFVLRMCVKAGDTVTRSGLISRLIEALASALESNNFDVEKIEIRVVGREKTTTAVIYLRGAGYGVYIPQV
ncbi:MAG: hypothetical protein QW503_02365 [Sulfolobales archaeon]